ncbi:MAG: helix-turn-helix domain-containing protein [Raoultibacter sp.]
MARRDTKDVIAIEALRLFASIGYEGASMRDIAAAVGIQPASLYKHFSGKQALCDAVVERMNQEYNRFATELALPAGTISDASKDYAALPATTMASLGEAMFRYWTEDEYAVLFRRMLTMEQYRSPEMGRLYRSYFIEGPVDYQATLFAKMMECGAFVRGNPRVFALEFFAPLVLLMQAADGCANASERAEVVTLVREHIAQFVNSHGPESMQHQ